MLMSRYQKAGQKHIIYIANRSFEDVLFVNNTNEPKFDARRN
jgi:hypothetical protein